MSDCVSVWRVLVPAIVFDHVCQFNDKLALFVLLTGLKGMLLRRRNQDRYIHGTVGHTLLLHLPHM